MTYVWIVTNRKKGTRKGKIQLIDGTSFFERMRKPLGEKRKLISEEQKDELTRIYGDFMEGEFCKIFDEDDFAYWKVTVERPLRLNFQTSSERIERIREQKAFANLATSRKRKPAEHDAEVAEGKSSRKPSLPLSARLMGQCFIRTAPSSANCSKRHSRKRGLM